MVSFGSKAFIEKIKNELGIRAVQRRINKVDESFELLEKQILYSTNLPPPWIQVISTQLSKENGYLWDIY